MKTHLTTSPKIASEFIKKGELVAFPTETVYGLGADLFNEKAIKNIFRAKGRPFDNPLIVHISKIDDISMLVKKIPKLAERLIEIFFPGPLTILFKKSEIVSPLVTAGLNTVGIRMPNHPLTKQFLKFCNTPIVAPSANRSGKPSPTTWQAVKADLDGRIACILKGSQTIVGLESTVVDCTGKVPVILRAGAISLEQLKKIIPSTKVFVSSKVSKAKSPGMKYRHYAPEAHIIIVSSPKNISAGKSLAYIGLEKPPNMNLFGLVNICKNVSDYAHALFKFFRLCDNKNIKTIYCQSVEQKELGLALMDRIKRAAH